MHEGATPFKCETCDKPFTRKEDLAKHVNLHAGIKRNFFLFSLFYFNLKNF